MILAGASVAFVAGVWLGSLFGPTGWVPLVLAALFGLLAWLARRHRGWPVVLLAAALCLGFWRSPHVGPATPTDLRYYNGRVVQITGTVSAEPDIRDTGANYQVTIDGLQTGTIAHAVTGGLYVHTSSAVHLDYGDRVSIRGRLLSTGASGYGASLNRQGVYSEVRYPRLVDLGPSSSTSPLSAALIHLRQRLEAGIDAWLPEPEAALLVAITLGARSSELGDLAPVLVTTGLIHLIAISGIKVALVAGMIQQAVRSFAGRLLSLFGATGALWLYVLLTGLTPSGARSAGMWTLVFIASALGRQTLSLLSLAIVAAVMVGIDPSLPADIGFQLSTVGTLTIVAFAGQVDRAVSAIRLPLPASLHSGSLVPDSIPLVPSPFREALAVTLAAQIGTVPIVIVGFHTVSGTGPLSNMLVLPFLPLLIVLGFLLGALSGLASLAQPLASLAYALLHSGLWLIDSVASWGGAPKLASFGALVVVGYYALLIAGKVMLERRRVPSHSTYGGQRREIAIASGVGLCLLTVSVATAQSIPTTRLTWLGSGNAMLLQAGGESALIDGSNHPFTLLERLGAALPPDTRAIDLVVVTDPRSSNVSGLESLLQHYHLGEVLDVGAEYPSTTYARWRADLRSGRIPVYALRTGVSVSLGPAHLTAVGPDAVYPKAQDSAGMLRIALPDRVLLLATGADTREQHEAVFRGVALHADTLVPGKVSDPAFVRAVGARVVRDTRSLGGTSRTLYPSSCRFASIH